MLDDNWISIVEDYPEYGKIFEKGSNLYDNFMYILQNSTITWVYNDNLARDLKVFSKKIIKDLDKGLSFEEAIASIKFFDKCKTNSKK